MHWLVSFVLFPFSCLYDLATRTRNHLFDIGNKKSHRFDVLTIGVGNLKVGGVGKTPFCEFLLAQCLTHQKVAVLSRGYGRKTKGFFEVGGQSTSLEVGDESLQMFHQFPNARFFVCRERILGIPEIMHRYPDTEVILLDDVFQHRHVNPHLNLLLTAYGDLFSSDHVLPMGRLREARKGARRADAIVVTKSPLKRTESQENAVIQALKPYVCPGTPVFFSAVHSAPLELVLGTHHHPTKALVVSAVANNQTFSETIAQGLDVVKAFGFRDHHHFSLKEIKEIIKFGSNLGINVLVTTQKDWQRLKLFRSVLMDHHFSVLTAPIYFDLEQKNELIARIQNAQKLV